MSLSDSWVFLHVPWRTLILFSSSKLRRTSQRPVGPGLQRKGQESSLLWPGVFLCPCYRLPQNTQIAFSSRVVAVWLMHVSLNSFGNSLKHWGSQSLEFKSQTCPESSPGWLARLPFNSWGLRSLLFYPYRQLRPLVLVEFYPILVAARLIGNQV